MDKYDVAEFRAAFTCLVDYIRRHYKCVVNLSELNKAFGAALEYASGDNPERGESLREALRIAQDMALFQCQSIILFCAILLDLPRDIVKTLQIKDTYETLEAYDALNNDNTWVNKLHKTSIHLYWAIQLRCEKAHKELHTNADVPSSTLAFVSSTLIPMAETMNMRYYVRLLRNDCYARECDDSGHHSYPTVWEHIQALNAVSASAYRRFDEQMSEALTAQRQFSAVDEYGFTDLNKCTFRRAIPCWEVKEQALVTNSYDRSVLDLWEVILAYEDPDETNMVRDYIRFHREYLRDYLTVQYVGKENHSITFRLTDSIENNYLVKLVPKHQVHTYLFGNEETLGANFPQSFDELTYSNEVITVYVQTQEDNGNECCKKVIPLGSTVLDLAFYASPTDAIMVRSARIHQMTAGKPPSFDETDYSYPLHTVLKENDVVSFVASPVFGNGCTPHATIDWFSYITTEYAKKCLIKYLKEKYS